MASPQHSPAKPSDMDRLQGWLVALPALVLALPGRLSLLRDVPTTTSAAAGILALGCLPCLALLALRRRPVHLRGLLPWLTLLLVAAVGARDAGDPFAARRAMLSLSAGIGLMLAGASLGSEGRRSVVTGLCVACGLLLADTLVDRLGDAEHLPLGNSGDLSEALLPGAVIAIASSVYWSRPWSGLGLLLGLGTILFMGVTPVLAGLVALFGTGVVSLLAVRSSSGTTANWTRNLLLMGLGGWLVLASGLGGASEAQDPNPHATAAVRTTTGGWRVRSLIWSTLPSVVNEAPVLGHGPGQFARVYPPHRDPAELALSSHDHAEPTPIEVEHVHNDWLQPFVEWGWVAGFGWVGLLLLAARRALALLSAAHGPTRACAAAGLAILINAAFNSPLLYGVASPACAWPLLGICLGSTPPAGATSPLSQIRQRSGNLAPWLILLILLANARSAYAFFVHGAELAGVVTAPVVEHDGVLSQSPDQVGPHLARALRAAPDSVVALEKYYQLQTATGVEPAERAVTLARILSARPYSFGPLLDRAILAAQQGDDEQALRLFSLAHDLDPLHPKLHRNRLLLAVDVGSQAEVRELLAALPSALSPAPQWLEGVAANALLNGRVAVGRDLLGVTDDSWQFGEALLAESQLAGRPNTPLGDGLVASGNALFARDHASRGDFESALRLYRQAMRGAQRYPLVPGGGQRLRLELAASLCRLDRVDEARDLLESHKASNVRYLRELPVWAGQALIDAGLLGG